MRFNNTYHLRLILTLFVASFFYLTALFHTAPAHADQTHDSDIQSAAEAAHNQDYDTELDDYLLAIAAEPGDTVAKATTLDLIEQNTPATINLTTVDKVSGIALPFDITVESTEIGTTGTERKTVLIVPHDPPPGEVDDPVEDWPFSRVAYVYSSQNGTKASLLCTLHYQSNDVAVLALRIGALLSVLDDVYAQKMLISRADDSFPFNVWLCSNAPVSSGGEQWRNNIYFYDVGDERSSIEWIREIAHEFSHLAFPAVGGSYTEPEAFANGYLGERLLVRWLARGAAGGAASVEAAWKGTFSGYPNFDRILIAPSLAAFNSSGLDKADLAQRNAAGMRYLIGMFLEVDDQCGSPTVGTILQGLADQHSTDPDLLYVPVKAALEQAAKRPK